MANSEGERIPPTTAVVVTYGSRSELCSETVRLAIRSGAELVLIVENGTSSQERKLLRSRLAAFEAHVTFLSLPENLGSAGGFACGIEAALKTSGSLIWLLDDDNYPSPEALSESFCALSRLEGQGTRAVTVFSLRLPMGVTTNTDVALRPYFPPVGSFMYFDVTGNFLRIWHRLLPPRRHEIVDVPYGPYGGLLARRQTLQRVDPPLSQYYLYEDDTEFTWRLSLLPMSRLALCTSSIVFDADTKWCEGESGTGPSRLLKAQDERRRHFTVRNRVAFDFQRAHGIQRLRFGANGLVYVAVTAVCAIRWKKWGAFRQVINSIFAGLRLARDVGNVSMHTSARSMLGG